MPASPWSKFRLLPSGAQERSSEFRLGIVESKHELGIDCTSRKWQFHRSGNKLPECSEAPLRKGMELEWE
ncbi:hypothetical protein AVEN_72431-1 [Araneus ventricosus]|uniref:Uncharacterized protein n=1 Tax=Araneus ventricosus TaxID=182803 RepID=A0A4Y2JTJ8_ARAVE|nr:hypothetical protein AVEN_72431-1 [Araneus ventricosus]